MKRVAIVAGGLALAVVAYWLVTRDSDSPPVPEPAPPPIERPHAVAVPPSLASEPRLPPDGAGVSSYTIDGIAVRDHRGAAAGKPLDLPPNLHRPNGRTIPPTLTAELSAKVRAVMAECARALPAAARGPRPRLDGELVVGIHGGTLTVTRALMQLRDVNGDPEPMRRCMEERSVGLTAPASDQADLADYSIHISFAVLGGAPPVAAP